MRIKNEDTDSKNIDSQKQDDLWPLREIQKQAQAKGLDKLSDEEIEAEVTAVREAQTRKGL